MLEKVEKVHEALMKAIEETDDEIEKLRNYVKTKGEVFRANVSMIRLYFAETRGASFTLVAGLDSEIRERHGHFLEALASIFESGIKRKRFMRIADPYLSWQLPSKALPMPFFSSGLKRLNAIHTLKTRTPS